MKLDINELFITIVFIILLEYVIICTQIVKARNVKIIFRPDTSVVTFLN